MGKRRPSTLHLALPSSSFAPVSSTSLLSLSLSSQRSIPTRKARARIHAHRRRHCVRRNRHHGGITLHPHISHSRERPCAGCLLPQVHSAESSGARRDRLCAQLARRPGRDPGGGNEDPGRCARGVVPQRVTKGAGDRRGRGGLHTACTSERWRGGDGYAASGSQDEQLRGEPLVERRKETKSGGLGGQLKEEEAGPIFLCCWLLSLRAFPRSLAFCCRAYVCVCVSWCCIAALR
ncbi:acylphosphatase, putative [Leishmania panamensis]|uniref:acylphosphatase n=1 Tax=Leishmania panamensis TaxID=5679 RepID=A0A088RSG1_LEIPA